MPVWDLVVEGDHSYVAQGLVHHNSGSPNLMNMTRSENDDPLHPNPMQRGFGLRDLFEPDEGHSFVVADYSQVELRLGAHISRDPVMIETYRRGGDIHAQAAIALFGLTCKEDEVAKLFPGERTKAKCFHPDTEVLTKVGWQRIVDIDESVEVMQAEPGPGCAVELSWTHPLQVFTQYHPDRRLVHLKNEGIDLRVTPDHRMVGFGVTGKPKVVPPDRLGKVRHWANAGMLNNRHGCPERPDERVLRLAVATQADGSFTPGHVIRFGFTKKRKIDRILKLLNEGEYTTSVSRVEPKDVTNVCVQRELADSIKSLLDKKSFPWRWLAMAPDLRDVVLDEARRWDGHDRDAWRMSMFLSTDRQSLDVLQALAAITNRKTRLAWPASKCGRLSIRDTHKTRGGNLSTKEIPWTDKVACLAVPSSYVLVRDGIAQIPVIVGQTFNFGIFYGAGANRVANEFRISKEEAKERIDAYFERFQGIKHLKTSVEHEARTKGYLRSLLGRYRHLPYIHRIAEKDLDWQMRQDDKMRSRYSGEFREALNFGPQGGAADCIQTAMLIADGEYVEWHPLQQDTRLLDLDATMLMQIHDELVLQAPTENAERAARALERVMTDPLPGLLVPILADAGYGGTWTSAKKAS